MPSNKQPKAIIILILSDKQKCLFLDISGTGIFNEKIDDFFKK